MTPSSQMNQPWPLSNLLKIATEKKEEDQASHVPSIPSNSMCAGPYLIFDVKFSYLQSKRYVKYCSLHLTDCYAFHNNSLLPPFSGIMARDFFEEEIIKRYARPYVREVFLGHIVSFKTMTQNTWACIANEGINWVKTPAESPDLNPI